MGNKSSKKHYKIPPNATKPDPPGKPDAETVPNGIHLRWKSPRSTGNCPIIGYIVQHSELDDGTWESSGPIPGTEALISNLEVGVPYQFRVIAENLIGYSIPGNSSDPVLFSSTEALPRFLIPLQSVSAIENERVNFFVQVTGKPYPQLKWFLNGEEIIPNHNIVLDELSHRLTINCATNDLQGEVVCSASNDQGIDACSAELIVGAPPRMLDEPSREIIFRVDELLRIKFNFSGRPKPEVTWYHNGVGIPEESSHIEVLANSTSLKIPHARRSDRGEYTVQIENNLGTDAGSVLVTVADKPLPPSAPTVVLLRDNSCLLEWEEGTDDGGCPVNIYIVEYFRSGWDVWLTGATTRSKTTKVRDLIPGSRYRFRVKSENLYGVSDSSTDSVELPIPEQPCPGLMTPLAETEEEESTSTTSATVHRVVLPVNEVLSSPSLSSVRKPLGRWSLTSSPKPLAFDHYQSRSSELSRRIVSNRGRSNLAKTTSLPREINNVDLPPLTSQSVSSSSHMMYEGSSSSSEEIDASLVTRSSLTVLKSGSCLIKTSSGEELRTSYDHLSSGRATTSKNSLNSEDFDYYNSIFGKTQVDSEELDQADDEEFESIPHSVVAGGDIDDTAVSVAVDPYWLWPWWLYFLVGLGLCSCFKYLFIANVFILTYTLFRFGKLWFE